MATIRIDPVTRIEGHARVLLEMADDATVSSARLVVNELRGFERLLVGMEADRMPLVTARICGVCPVTHTLAAVQALEDAFQVAPPPAARLLRELLCMGQLVHSHALHLFALGKDRTRARKGRQRKGRRGADHARLVRRDGEARRGRGGG